MALISEPTEIEPLAVSPKKARALIDVGTTRLYHLIGTGEVESFRDGKSRKIIFASPTERASWQSLPARLGAAVTRFFTARVMQMKASEPES